jgi:hypothetical protein
MNTWITISFQDARFVGLSLPAVQHVRASRLALWTTISTINIINIKRYPAGVE